MASANLKMSGLETIFLLAEEKWENVSSSLVKEIFQNKGDITPFVPKEIINFLNKKLI